MMVVLILFLGGEVIHDFTIALIVGLITGTYSTIYVASPVVLLLENMSPAIGEEGRPGELLVPSGRRSEGLTAPLFILYLIV